MGQYHILVNLDKQEWVDPLGLGLGLKQYEQTGCEASLSDAMYLLMMSSPASGGGDFKMVEGVNGRWCGDKVVVVGDYTPENGIPGYEGNANALYEKAQATFVDITQSVRDAFEEIYEIKYVSKNFGSFSSWSRAI